MTKYPEFSWEILLYNERLQNNILECKKMLRVTRNNVIAKLSKKKKLHTQRGCMNNYRLFSEFLYS